MDKERLGLLRDRYSTSWLTRRGIGGRCWGHGLGARGVGKGGGGEAGKEELGNEE